MDTSFWTQCNHKIAFGHTQKQFFGKFLCKLVISASAARYINEADSTVSNLIDARKAIYQGNANSWWVRGITTLTDPMYLEHIQAIKNKNKHLKYRLDDYTMSVYANTDQDLRDFFSQIDPKYQKNVISLITPKDDHDAQLLVNGFILETTVDYKYKVMLRDGIYEKDTKAQVLGYLQGCGTEIAMLPRAMVKSMTHDSRYMWGCYFYTNDISILTFLSIISPTMVLRYNEMQKKNKSKV